MINNIFNILIKPLLVSLTINRRRFETPNKPVDHLAFNMPNVATTNWQFHELSVGSLKKSLN
jgi:hypothetical protein